ncbi:MAG: twin-arginine translocation signal domain-containing protein [Gammaproteobacteria bacterium]|nr:twin-arginine translocation signal domain-containing protein [Gammaproteobacteria bacterium]
MKKQPATTDQQRRDFLQKSVTTAAIAATVPGIAVAGTLDHPDNNTQDGSDKSANRKAGYQLSAHVAAYYKSCMR